MALVRTGKRVLEEEGIVTEKFSETRFHIETIPSRLGPVKGCAPFDTVKHLANF